MLDHFLFLEFDQLRVLPDFGSAQPTVQDKVSFRVSAQALFIGIAAVRVLYEFWRKKYWTFLFEDDTLNLSQNAFRRPAACTDE